MARPSKSIYLVNGHRTKAEIKHREKAEGSLITGDKMREWKTTRAMPAAHAHWHRISKLYAAIGKNDALIESVLNRYCQLLAECEYLQGAKKDAMNDLEKMLVNDEIDFMTKLEIKDQLQSRILSTEKIIMTKRKMLLDIERENIMTLAAQLRSIPKKPEEKKQASGMAAFMAKRADTN